MVRVQIRLVSASSSVMLVLNQKIAMLVNRLKKKLHGAVVNNPLVLTTHTTNCIDLKEQHGQHRAIGEPRPAGSGISGVAREDYTNSANR